MKRIVVTGLGCISPLGHGREEFERNLLRGQNGVGPITRFDTARFTSRVAGEVKDYDETRYFPADRARQLDRFAQFAVVSAREAWRDAGLPAGGDLLRRTAVIHGTGVGGLNTIDASFHRIYAEKAERLHPFTVPRMMPSAGACQISMELGVSGPAFGTVSACASSGHAVGLGAALLRAGLADAVVAGGAEACLTPGTYRAWEGLRVMAADACRPFSRGRGGMVLGEGAATLILETRVHAEARGARIHAELVGVGWGSDAADLIQPTVDGPVRAMEMALADAGLPPAAVDYVNAHGTGTTQNDPTETRAIHQVFGPHARRLAVSSSKSMFGHLLGAGAALEAVAAIAAIRANVAPPTIGYLGPDPACDLDYVPNEPRPMRIDVAQSNSLGFGGMNTVLLFRRYRG